MLLELQHLEGLGGRIALDIENDPTPNMRYRPGHLLGLGVWSPDNEVYGFFPTDTPEAERALRRVIKTWRPGSYLIAHNAKYELRWLRFKDWHLDRFHVVDTMVAEHLLAEEYTKDLGSCETRRLRRTTKKQLLAAVEGSTGLGIKKIASWPLEWIAEYCINDCRITYELAEHYFPALRREGLQDLFMTSMRYLRALYRAEERGMLVGEPESRALEAQIKQLRAAGLEQLRQQTGVQDLPNLNSPKQLSTFLYEDLGLTRPPCPPDLIGSPQAKPFLTETGVAEAVLELLQHPAAKTVVQVKKIGKVESYLKSYYKLGQRTEDGWVVRSNFNQTGAITGRLSSSTPNLQQVSARPVAKGLGPEGRGLLLRNVFRARNGHSIVGIDYKQMEVVGFGMMSGEPTMLKLIRQQEDMHNQVADLLFGPREDPSADHPNRYYTKSINFGLLYGLGDAALAKMLGLDIEETRKLKNRYLATFSRVRPWMVKVSAELESLGYVRYWSGRKRRIRDRDRFYKGVNAVVQGGCADILMVAAIRVDEYLRSEAKGYLLAPVHDELVFELPNDDLKRMIPEIREIMSVPDLLGVPFGTDVSVGRVWGQV